MQRPIAKHYLDFRESCEREGGLTFSERRGGWVREMELRGGDWEEKREWKLQLRCKVH
jgi:hypothetical protein